MPIIAARPLSSSFCLVKGPMGSDTVLVVKTLRDAATKSARDVRRGGPIDEARSGQIVTAHGNAEAVRVTSRLQGGAKQTPYRLRRDLMSDELSRELEDFVKFLTARRLGSVDAPIREVTARKYVDHVLGVFGWMHHHGGRGRYEP